MKKLLILVALPCCAAIGNLRQTGATPREVILRYTAPTPAACTIEVSESATYTPLVNDVNTALFAGSNSDFRNGAQGRGRTFIIGAAGTGVNYAPVDLTGKRSSRALQTNTNYYYRLTCGSDTATGTFRTANIAPGDTLPGTISPVDPATPGVNAWPSIDWTSTTGQIDPVHGTYVQKMMRVNAERLNYTVFRSVNKTYDATATWVNPNNALAEDAAVATYTGSANNPLLLTTSAGQDQQASLVGLTFQIRAFVDNSSTTAEVCLVQDGTNCYGPWVALPALPVGALGAQRYAGDPDIYSATIGTVTTPAMLGAWLSAGQALPDLRVRSGSADNVGAVVTLRASGQSFDTAWKTASHITFGGIEYTVASVQSSTEITLSSAPAGNTSATAWSSSSIGFKIRKSSVGGTLSVDSVHFRYNIYEAPTINGGSGASKQCTTKRYPEGWRIGVDLLGDGATNAAPIVIRSAQTHDFVTGDVVKIIDVPGNVAANGTWTVTVIDPTHYSLNGSNGTASGAYPSGSFNVYSGGGLAWKLTANTGHLCFIFDSGTAKQLYWINPDTTPADIRYLGTTYLNATGAWGGGASGTSSSGVLDEADPDMPRLYQTVEIAGKSELIRGKYIGNLSLGMFRDVGADTQGGPGNTTNIWNWTRLTPSPNTLSDRWLAFDATAPSSIYLDREPKPGILAFYSRLGQQNSMGWLAVYNTNTNAVAGVMNSWANPGYRYGGIHTALAFEGADLYNTVPYQLNGYNGSYSGPYEITTTSALNATPTDCATQLAALSLSNPLNITGNQCSTVTVAGVVPTSRPGSTPASDTLGGQTIAIGDRFGFGEPSSTNEIGRLVNFSGTSLVLQRGLVVTDIANGTVNTHASGGTMYEFSGFDIKWWDYVNDPHGTSGVTNEPNFLSESHYFTRDGFSVSDTGGASGVTPAVACPFPAVYNDAYYYRNYPWPDHLSAPTSAFGCVSGNPAFDDKFGNGFGNTLERHPSPVNNILSNPSWFDAKPHTDADTWPGTTTKVGTYVYKTTGYGSTTGPAFDPKRNKLYLTVGTHTVLDVSAAGFTLPDTVPYNYTYCVTHVTGECWSASSVGDVYTNAPFVSKRPLGTANAGTYACIQKGQAWTDAEGNSICITTQPTYADMVVQFSALHDPMNTGSRRVTNGFSSQRSTFGTWTAPPLPNGDWAMLLARWMYLVKIPPYPGPQRGQNRGSWLPIPVNITSVPRNTTAAYIRFGYNPSMWCSTRQERCAATGAGIQSGSSVYSYETSDSPAGLTCSSSCVITIPALSQRIMFYQIVYLNGSTIIKAGDVQVVSTP